MIGPILSHSLCILRWSARTPCNGARLKRDRQARHPLRLTLPHLCTSPLPIVFYPTTFCLTSTNDCLTSGHASMTEHWRREARSIDLACLCARLIPLNVCFGRPRRGGKEFGIMRTGRLLMWREVDKRAASVFSRGVGVNKGQ